MVGNRVTSAFPARPESLDEAAPCNSPEDLISTSARVVMGVVLRGFLDANNWTPLELICLPKCYRQLQSHGGLIENLVQRVAAVQSQSAGSDRKERVNALKKLVDILAERARAGELALHGLPNATGLVRAVADRAPSPGGGTATDDLRRAMAAELNECVGWGAKFDRAMAYAENERTVSVADDAIADILGSMNALQEVFGLPAANPATILITLCVTVFGAAGGDAKGRTGSLGALMAKTRLPETRRATIDRVVRWLRSPEPIGHGPASEDADVLLKILGHIVTPTGVIGGPAMAEALTTRYSRRLQQGGAAAFRRSVVGLSEMQSDLFCRCHYLAAIARAPLAERHLDEIASAVDAAFANERLIETVVLSDIPGTILRAQVDATAQALKNAPLPDSARAIQRLTTVLDAPAKSGLLLRRLSEEEPVLRRRVLRLAELAVSGLVSEDGGLPRLRQQIFDATRFPEFQRELIGGGESDRARGELQRLLPLLEKVRRTQPAPENGKPPVADNKGAAAVQSAPPTLAPTIALAQPPASEGTGKPVYQPVQRIDGRALCPHCLNPVTNFRVVCPRCQYPQRSDNRAGLHLAPGTILNGRFRAGQLLGQGGFGATYLGWDDRLEVKVAIKEYYPANMVSRMSGGPAVAPLGGTAGEGFSVGLTKFLEEARILAKLREIKEIVVVHDFFEENGTAYMVMELLQGRTLKRYIAESGGTVEAKRLFSILSPIMKALQAVHDRGLIHRDVSPDNIFLTTAGDRKLLDFGAARDATARANNMTVILKPGYAPPEQYSRDAHQGPWTDVYGLCATFYCGLTGKIPPDATQRLIRDVVPRPIEYGVDVSQAFEKVLFSGLAMRQADRPQTMRDLLKAMAGALEG